jgi:LPS sulfotransferase NodH
VSARIRELKPVAMSENNNRSMWRSARGAASFQAKRAGHQIRIRWASRRGGAGDWTPIFIVSQPRTGSTYLQELLDSVPDVTMTGEVLSVTLPIGIRRSASRGAALRHIRRSLCALPGRFRGAKFLIDQMRLHEVTLDDLREQFPRAKYLILYRESVLEQMVSFRVARATSQWVGRNGERYKFTDQIRIPLEELRQHFEGEREKYAGPLSHEWLQDCGALVSYEGLVEAPQEVFNSIIFPLLEIPESAVGSDLTKQMSRAMSDVVENYAELEPHLNELSLHLDWEASKEHAHAV